jgi:hypothetical protein
MKFFNLCGPILQARSHFPLQNPELQTFGVRKERTKETPIILHHYIYAKTSFDFMNKSEQRRLLLHPVLIFEFWYGDKEQLLLLLCVSRGHFLQLDLNWFINASLGARWAKGSFLKMKEHKLRLMCAAQFFWQHWNYFSTDRSNILPVAKVAFRQATKNSQKSINVYCPMSITI